MKPKKTRFNQAILKMKRMEKLFQNINFLRIELEGYMTEEEENSLDNYENKVKEILIEHRTLK